MQNKLDELINSSIIEIINHSKNSKKLKKLKNTHLKKLHFIPQRYRIFGGILQSMNIQFGNFIEVLMTKLIENEEKYEIIKKYNGKRNNKFQILSAKDSLIDEYITKCQTEEIILEDEFYKLQKKLSKKYFNGTMIQVKHDIDLVFKDKKTGIIYYVEIKYNDDHDTGKFVDMNRKFIKTYAYLLTEFNIEDSSKIVPILFYFNNKKMKGNNYIPEKINIRRGKKFFDEFLSMPYEILENYLLELSEKPENIQKFDNLYKFVMTEGY